MSLITAELSRRNYHGRMYAKAQNVRPAYIKAYDAALADVGVLVVPTCLMTAPKDHRPGSYQEAVEDNLTSMARGFSRNTQPFNYTGHPASPSRWASRPRVFRRACRSWDGSSTIRFSCGSPAPTRARATGGRSSASEPERARPGSGEGRRRKRRVIALRAESSGCFPVSPDMLATPAACALRVRQVLHPLSSPDALPGLGDVDHGRRIRSVVDLDRRRERRLRTPARQVDRHAAHVDQQRVLARPRLPIVTAAAGLVPGAVVNRAVVAVFFS